MAGRHLSAEDLMKYFNGQVTELPQRGGPKDYCPDGSWLQNKTLDHYYQERRNVLSEERVKKKGHLVRGDWRPKLGKVETPRNTGKFWKTVGHVEDGRYFLYPEEALSLLEKGDLELYYGELPLSVQEAYSTLLSDSVPLEHYQVYSHLARLGYIVSRHNKDVKLYTEYEHKIGLSKQQSKKNKKKRKAAPEENVIPGKITKLSATGTNDCTKHTEQMDCNDVILNSQDHLDRTLVSPEKCDSNNDQSEKLSSVCRHWNSPNTDNQTSPRCLSQSDYSDITFPNLSGGSQEFGRPDETCLPSGISLEKDRYHVNLHVYNNSAAMSSQPSLEGCSIGRVSLRTKVKASCWADYKKQMTKDSQGADVLRSTPAGHLWTGEVQPLISPQQATSTVSILERMKIMQNINFTDSSQTGFPETSNTSAGFIYDVHHPDSSFSKTNPGPPAFRLCIRRQDETCPTLAEIVQASRCSTDRASVQWAVVDSGDITFYSFNGVDLPQSVTVH